MADEKTNPDKHSSGEQQNGQRKSLASAIGELQRRVGNKLRQLRERHKWSTELFAEMCGIGVEQLNQIEDGHLDFSLAELVVMAEKLGTTASQILLPPHPPTADSPESRN
jgi:DNA-binding XRE family transcriptional regulator